MSRCCPASLVSRLLLFLCLLVIAHNFRVRALGQGATATISGTVEDEKGALIPGANITVKNISTALQRQVTTNSQGYFTVPLLPPSTYTITVESNGFAPVQINDVVLNISDQKALKVQLKAGAISATIEVTGEAPLISESPAVGTVVDRQFVENLPLNGRSFQALIALTPGVVLTKANASDQGQFSVNGQRANANYFTIDGVSANVGVSANFSPTQGGAGSLPGLSASGGTNSMASIEALQEFKVLTSSYAPEFGRQPGGQVQIVTRAGTNNFHGSLFEYFRNDVLDANDWFANANRLRKPALRQNDFGGVLGGPILKGRTFFFFSYEGLRLRQPLVAIKDVPTRALRQAVSAALRPFLDVFPLPTGPDQINPATGRPTGFAPFTASYSNPSALDATSIRIDHTFSSKLSLFGRYNNSPSESVLRGNSTLSASNTNVSQIKTQTVTLGATSVFTPTINNELRFNWTRNSGSTSSFLDDFGGATALPDSAIFPSPFSADDGRYALLIIAGTNPTYQIGRQADNLVRQINFIDNFNVQLGSHQLRVGVDYRTLTPSYAPQVYETTALFTGTGITAAGVPAPSGSVLSGRATTASVRSRPETVVKFNNFSAFAQDTWNATKRLTLTYGLRWEVNPPPKITKGPEFLSVTGLDNLATLSLAPAGTPIWKTTYNNFAPRFGLAYQLFQRSGRQTVLRGGIGIFYDLGTTTALDSAFNVRGARDFSNAIYPLSPEQRVPPPLVLSPPFSTLRVYDPELKLPRVYQWNAAVEQSLGAYQTISVSYVGAVGRRLLRQTIITNMAQIAPDIRLNSNGATSDYHALQTQFQQRMTRRLQVLASYTWAHAIDDFSSDGSFDFSSNRGPADFDVRHAFSTALTYNLPNPFKNSVGAAILGGWSVDGIFSARTATPVNVTTTRIVIGGLQIDQRPDRVDGVPLYLNDPLAPGGKRFNPAAFATPPLPPPGGVRRQGTLGRNSLRGFPISQLDFAVRRKFNLTERVNLQFRAELFNLLNHPNFADPVSRLTAANFGLSTSMFGRSLGSGGDAGGLNPLYQIGGPRSVQLTLKLQF
jgi:hypothetical protein